jgi:hypothetical protein
LEIVPNKALSLSLSSLPALPQALEQREAVIDEMKGVLMEQV